MAPVKVFGPAMSTNVARVLVCLEEVGAEYEVANIDFKVMEHKSPEHLARNPFGQIPAFQDGDLLLWEASKHREMTPVKVFGPAMLTNVARVLVCLEEVGAEYEVVNIDFKTLEHKSSEHLARNPFGQMPAFQDGDLLLWESRAISKYVLRKYKTDEVDLLREGKLAEAAMVDVWTEVGAHTYNPALSPIVHQCLFNPTMWGLPTDEKVVADSLEKLKKVLEVYEARLSKHRYLAGDFVSFADLSHFPSTFYFMATPHAGLFDSYPHVKAWSESVMARPAVKKIAAAMVPPKA